MSRKIEAHGKNSFELSIMILQELNVSIPYKPYHTKTLAM